VAERVVKSRSATALCSAWLAVMPLPPTAVGTSGDPATLQQASEPAGAGRSSVRAVPRQPKTILAMADAWDFDGVVREILRGAGACERRLVIQRSAGIPTAGATVVGGTAVILYNPAFVSTLELTARTNWAVVFLFAHEVSHQLLGHAAPGRDVTMDPTAMELQADMWSGFIFENLGASLEETRQSIESLGSLLESIRPDARWRLAAAERGWSTGARTGRPGRIAGRVLAL